MLLHEWDLASSGRHTLTDVYVCLQLLAFVRLPAGALSSQAAAAASGLERPDSRQSNATASSLTTSTCAAAKAVGDAGQGGGSSGRQQRKPGKRGTISAAWEGLQASGPAAGAAAPKGGLTLKEAYLKERVAALEAELAQARSGKGAVHSKEVSSSLHWFMAAAVGGDPGPSATVGSA